MRFNFHNRTKENDNKYQQSKVTFTECSSRQNPASPVKILKEKYSIHEIFADQKKKDQ
jgi:hypothetical protein